MDTQKTLAELVRRNETGFTTGTTTISKYVDFELSENLNKIDAYLNSKHTTGETDSLGREKPFFNIVTAATNIWYRATDLDRRHIIMKPTRESQIFASYVATAHLQDWMRRDNFGKFLNDWGRSLARYGSTVVKFIESEGMLHSMVVPWNRLIVDPVAFDNDVVIEVMELTPAQLKKRKGYDQKMVDELILAADARETTDKQRKDNDDNNFIRIYEVHGEMPLSFITDKAKDNDTYVQQMHVISFMASKQNGEFDEYTLIKGREKQQPYMVTHLIEEDGRTQSIGAVEYLFDAQWMMNHTAKQIKDQLDLSSKLIFQTSDGNFVGQNALSAIETGDILVHAAGSPLTQVANNSHDITSLQNYGQQWKTLGNEIVGISDSMLGNPAPSGTAWRQVEALLQENHSLFEVMVENKGIALETMIRTYIIPFLKTKMNTTDEVVATLEDYGIDKIERRYIKNKALENVKDKAKVAILDRKPLPELNIGKEESNIAEGLSENGALRFLTPSDLEGLKWKDVFDDFEWEVEIDITAEQRTNANDMSTLATVFQTVVSNPGVLQDPNAKMLFNKILTTTGTVSPIQLAETQSQPQPQQTVAPSGGQVGASLGNLAATDNQ